MEARCRVVGLIQEKLNHVNGVITGVEQRHDALMVLRLTSNSSHAFMIEITVRSTGFPSAPGRISEEQGCAISGAS
jgi:hypothetical protein